MSEKRLNMYMGYSKSMGPEEGAFLVFARTAKEARTVFWRGDAYLVCDDYLDAAVRRLRDCDWLYEDANQKKLENNIAHEVEPKACYECGMWGQSPISNLSGMCESCASDK